MNNTPLDLAYFYVKRSFKMVGVFLNTTHSNSFTWSSILLFTSMHLPTHLTSLGDPCIGVEQCNVLEMSVQRVFYTHQIDGLREPHLGMGFGQTDQGLQLPREGGNLPTAGTDLNRK